MAQEFDIRIITRNDFLVSWEASSSLIKKGELAIAYDSTGKPVELKIGINGAGGLGATWNATPSGLIPFIEIDVTSGRDLDNPGGLRNKTWKLETLNDALLEIFAPYVAPTLALSPDTFSIQEVGNTYTLSNHLFNVGLYNAQNILIEGDKKLYVDDTARALADQVDQTTNENVTKTFTANTNSAINVEVLNVFVKNSRDSVKIRKISNVPFKFRTGYFLVKASEDVFSKIDSELTTLIKNNAVSNITGVRGSVIGGSQNFGQVMFLNGNIPTADLAPNGRYTLYVYTPETSAIPVFSTKGDEATPILDKSSKLFTYTNGTANTAYRITKLGTSTSSTIAGGELLNIN